MAEPFDQSVKRFDEMAGKEPKANLSPGIPVASSSPDEISLSAFSLHSKLKERLLTSLDNELNRLRSIDPNDGVKIAICQTKVSMIEFVLRLPEQIFAEEKQRAGRL